MLYLHLFINAGTGAGQGEGIVQTTFSLCRGIQFNPIFYEKMCLIFIFLVCIVQSKNDQIYEWRRRNNKYLRQSVH